MHVIKILTVLKIDNKNKADPTASFPHASHGYRGKGQQTLPRAKSRPLSDFANSVLWESRDGRSFLY